MALQQGSRSFKVTASAADQATPEMTFDDIVALKDYNITTDYRLHPDADYHSLDNAHTLNVVTEVADHHLIHCGTSGTLIKTGDFIVGTADAAWRHRKFSVKTMHQKGLVYIRRAVAQDPVEDHGLQHKDSSPIVCVKTSTLEIHPFELFESFHVETVAHIPYIYKPLDREDKEVNPKASKGAKTTARAFKKKHAAAQPAGVATQALPVDPPAQTCSAIEETYFADYDEVYFSGFNSGSNDDFSFILGATVGKRNFLFS